MPSPRRPAARASRCGRLAAVLLSPAVALRFSDDKPPRFQCERGDITLMRLSDSSLFPGESVRTPAKIALSKDFACPMTTALQCAPDLDILRPEATKVEKHRRACDTVFSMALRQALRDQGDWLPNSRSCIIVTPGKVIHFAAQGLWNETHRSRSGRPRLFRVDDPKSKWINVSEHPHCVEQGYKGLRCFFRFADLPEEDWTEAETKALETHSVLRAHVQEVLNGWGAPHSSTLQLLQFSQFTRLMFNRGKAFRDFYDARLRHVIHNSRGGFSVGLHVRRGDACNGRWLKRMTMADERTDGGRRRCYETEVYSRKLAVLQEKYDVTDVYLSSTDPMLEEFRADFPEQYNQLNWHYLEVDHDSLQGSTWYELREREEMMAIGPSSFADMWHLSNSEAIIGNMASHFTRVAWQLAMGRQGRFVPYVSVDGRSPCCDVGNTCEQGQVDKRTMGDCLLYRIGQEQFCFTKGDGPPVAHFGP